MPAEPTMSVDDFVAKWQRVSAGETQAAQSHFNDLCAVLGVENPIEGDPEGVAYAFEKGVKRPDGSTGQADVRKEGYFGWEYKGKNKNLAAAYEQLLGYREGLGNPPLLVVCDMNRFEVHTNFTNTEPRVIRFALKDLRDNPTHFVKLLRDVFLDPQALHPNNDPRYITEVAAAKFGEVAQALRELDHDPNGGPFPQPPDLLLLRREHPAVPDDDRNTHEPGTSHPSRNDCRAPIAARSKRRRTSLRQLFSAMAKPEIGDQFRLHTRRRWFNGGLFDESAPTETLPLTGGPRQHAAGDSGAGRGRGLTRRFSARCLSAVLTRSRRSQTGCALHRPGQHHARGRAGDSAPAAS